MSEELNKFIINFEKAQKEWSPSGDQDELFKKLSKLKKESPEAFLGAMELFIENAKKGDSSKCYFITVIHDRVRDVEQFFYWINLAADNGHVGAQEKLGGAYLVGQNVDKDIDTSIYWLKKAGEQGSLNAQNNLSSIFYSGQLMPKNPEKAIYWTRKSANQGSASHQYILAHMYWTADGTNQSKKDAAYWANLARQKGHNKAEEMWNILELWKYQ